MSHFEKRQGGAALSREAVAAAQAVFDDWWERHSDVHDLNGGQGDTEGLFAALWESWKNFR